ncbi:beta-1,3-galactosyltransferase bre-2-like isoform X1 [Bolinopsis microptera]|uniref:beta-1,3-galactosyltransferase bre-2-like isoform X1 n=1 Tax=Bolinopsis microptera TaxID=2820187 RepID=UPI00307B0E56
MRQYLVPLAFLVPAFIFTILYVKQDGERLCSELKALEEELGQGREQVMGHLKEINSIKKVIDTEILILIITAPNNREFRDQLRLESYLNFPWTYSYKDDFNFHYAFVCGYSTNRTLLEEMRQEAVETGDLLIGDFEDTYENLVYKTIWLLRYAVERYTFDYMFKVDDDSFINPALLFDFLYKYIKPKYNDMNIGYYGGMIRHGSREVQREGQWGIQKWEFEPDILPPYHVGGAYILSHLAAKQIIDLNAKHIMVAFRIEDAYVGALADRIGLKARDIPKTYSKQYDRFCDDKGARIFHRVAPSWQAKMIYNWTMKGYYCQQTKSLEQIIEDGEEMLRKY